MMSSESSRIRETLEGFIAGRVQAERLMIAVATAYYGRDGAAGSRDGLGPLVDIIDRAAPGVVELGGVAGGGGGGGGGGFDIRLSERSLPKQYEQELRRAVEAYLASHRTTGVIGVSPVPADSPPGVFTRLVGAIRRLFSGSA